jgi:hypothetical protein
MTPSGDRGPLRVARKRGGASMLFAAISNRNTTPPAFLLLLPPLGNRHDRCRVETMPVQPRPCKKVHAGLATICDWQFADASQLQQGPRFRVGPPYSRQDLSPFAIVHQAVEKARPFLTASAQAGGLASCGWTCVLRIGQLSTTRTSAAVFGRVAQRPHASRWRGRSPTKVDHPTAELGPTGRCAGHTSSTGRGCPGQPICPRPHVTAAAMSDFCFSRPPLEASMAKCDA